ncbi:MAG TPA: winged helix DNA-binding domain-containing protein [Gemmatimonadales bacterium]|nr:winged helix DNA-binding domain-containing protein [Gemmatimonadales bacterium]
MTKEPDIAEQRLRNQLITPPGRRHPENVVSWLGATQAQEYGPAKWALGLRSAHGTTDAAIDRAIDQGRILRTHVLRPTWHFVTPADIRWMLELTSPQVHRTMSGYDRQLGLDIGVMTRAAGIIERAIGDCGHLTRGELGAHLERAGLPARSRELAHIMMYAELEGLICSGPRRQNKFTYALLADRAPAARRLSRDEALAELTLRYFTSHGPATIRDFVWWSGLRTTDVRLGLEMNRARSCEMDGLQYWTVGRSARRKPSREATVHLLPVYDEYLVAYRDHRAVPRPAYAFGGLQHALVIEGQVAGAWRATLAKNGIGVNVSPLRRLTPKERRGVALTGERYGKFLGMQVFLSIL